MKKNTFDSQQKKTHTPRHSPNIRIFNWICTSSRGKASFICLICFLSDFLASFELLWWNLIGKRFLTWWPWPLTYDLDLQTWPRYHSTWPTYQNSRLHVCPFTAESETHTDTQTMPKLLHPSLMRGKSYLICKVRLLIMQSNSILLTLFSEPKHDPVNINMEYLCFLTAGGGSTKYSIKNWGGLGKNSNFWKFRPITPPRINERSLNLHMWFQYWFITLKQTKNIN